ncbi:hypothetical protein BH11BAC1_BH11BAC1_07180 [soil metagenome]
MNGSFVGTNTKTASVPGTWPVDTLFCNFPQGFDSVVVHYDSPPPTCQDYGVIYMADNMQVTVSTSGIESINRFIDEISIPNPISQSEAISFSLLRSSTIRLNIYDVTGRFIKQLFAGNLDAGRHNIKWNINENSVKNGFYFLRITGDSFSHSYKLVFVN